MDGERAKRWLKFLVALAVSVLFSALFILSIDLDAVLDALADADYVYVPPALALFALSLIARALRWEVLLRPDRDEPWRKVLPSLLVGYAGNNLLPLRAGELLRAQHLMDHRRVPRMQTFGTLMMERLFDGIVLAAFVLWGLLLVDVGTAYLGLGVLLAAASAGGFFVCTLLALNPGVTKHLARLPYLPDRLREPIAALGASFLTGFEVLKSPSRFVAAALATVVAWGLEVGMYWLVSLAFHLDASFITIAFAGAAANVAMSLPSAQGGVGPFQYFSTEALLRFSIARSHAAAYSLALHIFLVVPVSLVGLLVLWRSTMPGQRRTPTVSSGAELPENP